MPNTHTTLTDLFEDIAQAIRDKKGESSSTKYVADDFPTAIADIPTGGGGGSITGIDRLQMSYDSVTYIAQSQQATVSKTVSRAADAQYYVIIAEVIYDTSLTSAGYAYAVADSTGTVIDSNVSGDVDSVTITKPSTNLKTTVLINRNQDTQHILYVCYKLT